MSKKLFPHVIRVHEVSSNGSILVCEYIQPFESYYHMIQHQEKIREILKDLSSLYLIGDVGLCDKNFGNWGIRVGSQSPVCLDFAYIYEVKSNLFVCDYCKNGSILVPNKDFTELYCSNPLCGKEWKFEDIRAKIGNTLRAHDLENLNEEGYVLDESFKMVELSPHKSTYLIKNKNVKKRNKNKEEKISIPIFCMQQEPSTYLNGGLKNEL